MAYTPNTWIPRQGTGLNRFQDQDGNYWYFTAAPEAVTQPGTPFSADWMNHIENGIAENSNNISNLIETGTFTPTLTTLPGSSVTANYTRQLGNYTKIGNVVVFSVYIRGNITNVSGTPFAKIAGVPFSAVVPTAVSIGTLYNCTTYIDGVSAVFQTDAYGDLISINFGGNNKDVGSNSNVWAVGNNFMINISGTLIVTD